MLCVYACSIDTYVWSGQESLSKRGSGLYSTYIDPVTALRSTFPVVLRYHFNLVCAYTLFESFPLFNMLSIICLNLKNCYYFYKVYYSLLTCIYCTISCRVLILDNSAHILGGWILLVRRMLPLIHWSSIQMLRSVLHVNIWTTRLWTEPQLDPRSSWA